MHEALTLSHNLIGNFLNVDACNMDTVITNGLEKMCHDAYIVASRSI